MYQKVLKHKICHENVQSDSIPFLNQQQRLVFKSVSRAFEIDLTTMLCRLRVYVATDVKMHQDLSVSFCFATPQFSLRVKKYRKFTPYFGVWPNGGIPSQISVLPLFRLPQPRLYVVSILRYLSLRYTCERVKVCVENERAHSGAVRMRIDRIFNLSDCFVLSLL